MVHGAPMLVVVPSSLHFFSAGSHTMFGHRVLQATLLQSSPSTPPSEQAVPPSVPASVPASAPASVPPSVPASVPPSVPPSTPASTPESAVTLGNLLLEQPTTTNANISVFRRIISPGRTLI